MIFGSTTFTSVQGHQSDEIETSGLIGNFVPTAGIASTHWTNQAAVNALRRYNGITFNTSTCLLYTSPSPRDGLLSRMPSSA